RADLYSNRSLAYGGLREHAKAVADLNQALDLGDSSTRIYLMRSSHLRQLGDKAGADRDLARGLPRGPTDEASWIDRGYAKLPKRDMDGKRDIDGALADFQRALKLNPKSQLALQNIAHILSEKGRTEEALRILDRELDLYPDHVYARSGR